MNILAIDLGTQMGWALISRDKQIRSGSQSFKNSVMDGPGQRWLKFRAFLTDLGRSVGEINALYFEDVKRHAPGAVLAAHAYGGFRAHLEAWCAMNQVRLIPVGVGTIKKGWTGNGSAKKELMISTAVARGFNPIDDNEADALAILDHARRQEAW